LCRAGDYAFNQNANGSSVSNATLTVTTTTADLFNGIMRDGTGGGTLG